MTFPQLLTFLDITPAFKKSVSSHKKNYWKITVYNNIKNLRNIYAKGKDFAKKFYHRYLIES